MGIAESKMNEILHAFEIDYARLNLIANDFCQDIKRGLDREASPFKMLKSYLGLPSGNETGCYLALDFGGTNVRVFAVELHGNGSYSVVKKVARPLVTKEYNYISRENTAEQLFDFIADLVTQITEENKQYLLGHTFSFGSKQTNLNNARLITWAKEFAVQGVEGEVVNELLQAAFVRKNRANVIPVAVINDTVATILTAAYEDTSTHIGSICGTGHNTAYLEEYGGKQAAMILNLETGNFARVPLNQYDVLVDAASEKVGQQLFEKMVAGRYLGTLFVVVLKEAGVIHRQMEVTSKDLADLIQDKSAEKQVIRKFLQEQGFDGVVDSMLVLQMQKLAEAIVRRSARLIAAEYIGIVQHIDHAFQRQHRIAIDGSLYEKMPNYAAIIQETLVELVGSEKARQLSLGLENSGSGIGGAIAAAIYKENNC